MVANAERLRALEAENDAIRPTNSELRALIDSVVPDSEDTERPNPISNIEQEVDRTAPITPTGPVDANPNVR